MKPFPTQSPSTLSLFEQCPKQWHETKVLKKYPFTVTEQITYGNEVHKNLEMYTKFKEPLPEHLEQVGKVIDSLRLSYKLAAELELAIDKDWNPVGFWDPKAMLRGKVDLVAVSKNDIIIIDWKTGNRKPDPFQLNVYGALLKHITKVPVVAVGFAWLKTKQRDVYSVSDQNFQEIRDDIMQRINTMKTAYEKQEFDARTSPLCCWCAALDDCEEAAYYRANKDKIRRGR